MPTIETYQLRLNMKHKGDKKINDWIKDVEKGCRCMIMKKILLDYIEGLSSCATKTSARDDEDKVRT